MIGNPGLEIGQISILIVDHSIVKAEWPVDERAELVIWRPRVQALP